MGAGQRIGIYRMTLDANGESSEVELWRGTDFRERGATVSPDGRWVAYASDDSGQAEVYVVPLDGSGGRPTLSTDGGDEPVWAHDGREIFYRNDARMMAVEVTTGPTFSAGTPRALFEMPSTPTFRWGIRNYDVHPDGQRFLVVEDEIGDRAVPIRIVLNWAEELKARVPVP